MRKLDSLLPQADESDVFGQHAVKLMQRAAEIGYEKAMAEELENPTWDDPDWCRMIVARVNGQVPTFPEDPSVTFRCYKCRDTGFVYRGVSEKHGTSYQVAAGCQPCAWRMWAKAKWQREQAESGPRRGGKLRNATEDGP